MRKSKYLAVDTETTGLEAHDQVFAVGMCNERLEKCFYRWTPFWIHKPSSFAKIKKVLEDSDTIKVFYNAVFDLCKLKKYGINVKGIINDVYFMGRILLPHEPKHNLRYLTKSQLGEDNDKLEAKIDKLTKGRNKITYKDLPKKMLKKHCKKDIEYTMKMFYYLKTCLKDPIYKMERDLIPVIVDMEHGGIHVDMKLCKKKEKEYQKKVSWLENYFTREHGIEKISSPKQLRDLLYNKWELSPPKLTTPKGDLSTDKLALILLRDEHVDIKKLERYRELKHSLTNYFTPIKNKAVRNSEGLNMIHPHFNPMGDIDRLGIPTGRFSSNRPNLQSIKRGPEIRSIFIPRPGYFLCSHDYSQIEMRLFAYLSNDKPMIKAYDEGKNIHKINQKMFVDPYIKDKDVVDGKGRNYMIAKHIGFEILYGMGARGMKKYLDRNEVHLSLGLVDKMIKRWHRKHPALMRMREILHNELRVHGYITDIFGRKYSLPLWRSYVSVNYIIQGMAAGILKTVMVPVHNMLKKHGGRLIITLHDELVTEIPKSKPELIDKITKLMENVREDFHIELPTEHHIGDRWGELRDPTHMRRGH